MSERILFFILLLWQTATVCPAYAQQKSDTTYTFRFVPQKDMFFVPCHGNDKEPAQLLECVENHKADILDGRMPLYVDVN